MDDDRCGAEVRRGWYNHDVQISIAQALGWRYRQLFQKSGAPKWAHPDIRPAAPFVGENYAKGPRILVYASAENIDKRSRGSDGGATDPWYTNDDAFDRHRQYWLKGSEACRPFTSVGIAPFDNRGLAHAAALLWVWTSEVASRPVPVTYREFVEHLAVANISKFTHRAGVTNRDPLDEQLACSAEYVRTDLETLAPRIILVARTRAGRWVQAGRQMLTIEMPQCAPYNVNCRRKCWDEQIEAQSVRESEVRAWLAEVPFLTELRSSAFDTSNPGPLRYCCLLRARYLRSAQSKWSSRAPFTS